LKNIFKIKNFIWAKILNWINKNYKMINKKYLVILIGLLAFFSLATLPFNALQPDDASMYGLAIKNTVLHNQWLMPLLHPGDPSSFLDKPLLGIWLQTLPLVFLPINEITIHIPNVIYYLVLLVVFYFFVKKEKGDEFALVGTFVLATALAVLIYSRTPKLDILLTLAITLAQFYLYQFWNGQKTWKYFCFWTGVGFLIKSGFALIFCGLTFLGLFLIDANFRNKLLKFVLRKEFYIGLSFFLIPVILLMGLPYFAAPVQYAHYLKSILWQSKYNLSYLGLGMHWNVLGYAFLAFFPWTIFLFNKNLYLVDQKKSLEKFSLIWIFSNILFLFFFYQQNDLRTFVSLVPPLAILTAGLLMQTNAKKIGSAFAALFLTLLLLTQVPQILNSTAVWPVLLWVVFLLIIFVYGFKLNQKLLQAALAVLLIGHVSLLFSGGALVGNANPYINWQKKLETRFYEKVYFYIYRPSDRPLFMSHDQAYLDFVSGPADAYVTEEKFFTRKKNYFLLTDPQSFKSLSLSKNETLFVDQYAVLVWVK